MTAKAGTPGRARTLLGFAAFGLFWGSWGGALPAIRAHAGVDDGALGLALLWVGAGALASMRPAGAVLDRFGAPVLPLTVTIFAGCALLPALSTSALALSGASCSAPSPGPSTWPSTPRASARRWRADDR